MSADDAAARRLDEQIDAMQAGGGTIPPDLAGDELATVAHLFLVDAAQLAQQPMPRERAIRRQLLEQAAAAPAGRRRGVGADGVARRARASVAAMWRAHRIIVVACCMLAMCTTLALADTHTPAGRAMRTAARAVNIPVPAEPATRRAERPADAAPGAVSSVVPSEAGGGAPSRGSDTAAAAPADAGGRGDVLPCDPECPLPGDAMGIGPDGEPIARAPRPIDGQPAPGIKPPPGGDVPPQPQPQPDGQQPAGPAPAPGAGPKPPLQPAPGPGPGPGPRPQPGGTQPAPQPGAPQPGAPMPGGTQPAPQPAP